MSPILAPYTEVWALEFDALRLVYGAVLEDLIERVEHVGSTAVPGLSAKPILDIDVVMPGYGVFPEIVERVASLGYTHLGNQGIAQREVFRPADDGVPWTTPPIRWMAHHLYVCPAGSAELQRHLAFRDALRARADWRERYQQIKEEIAGRARGSRRLYAEIKELECRGFVHGVVTGFIQNPR